MKITPKDYAQARGGLSKAGFASIGALLAEDKTITEVAVLYDIPELIVEIVKTTRSFEHYETVARLETERDALQQELDVVKEVEAKVKPKPWHYVTASIILIILAALIVWGIILLVGWVRSFTL